MRKHGLALLLLAVSTLVALIGFSGKRSAWADGPIPSGTDLRVAVSSRSDSYVLGEVVQLSISITNVGSSDAFVGGIDIPSGYLKIQIASEGQDFLQYSYGGISKRSIVILKPGETRRATANLLANSKPQVSHLSQDAARQSLKGMIVTDFAFPKKGVYFVKAILVRPDANGMRVESDPVRIEIREPEGADATIWNEIKDNAEIAYFMQENSIRSAKSDERDKLLEKIERLASTEGDGVLINQLRQNVEGFRRNELKRKVTLEKWKPTKN